jgi:hypothetical protein
MALDLVLGFLELANFGMRAAAKRARTRNHAKLAWDRAATLLHTSREPDPQNEDWPRFVAIVDGNSVTVESVGGVDGHTRVRATSSAPNHERLKIYAADSLTSIARVVGVVDVRLGDAAFDESFIVKGNDAEFARMWVNSAVRKRLSRALDYQFELKNRRAFATTKGLETDDKNLVRAVRAVAALANGRQRVLRNWGKLKRRYSAKLKPERERWASLKGEHEGVAFTLDTYEHADRHFTTVVARVTKALLPPCIVAHERHHVATTLPRVVQLDGDSGFRWFTETPERAIALLGESPIATLAALGVTKLKVEPERVTLFTPGICVRPNKLAGLIALACSISRGSDVAPYR